MEALHLDLRQNVILLTLPTGALCSSCVQLPYWVLTVLFAGTAMAMSNPFAVLPLSRLPNRPALCLTKHVAVQRRRAHECMRACLTSALRGKGSPRAEPVPPSTTLAPSTAPSPQPRRFRGCLPPASALLVQANASPPQAPCAAKGDMPAPARVCRKAVPPASAQGIPSRGLGSAPAPLGGRKRSRSDSAEASGKQS